MFNCSACGCPASSHPVCPAWSRNHEAKKREDERTYRQRRSQQQQQQQLDRTRRTSALHDAYMQLQVAPGACERDVTRSYKRLARLYHPDKGRMKDGGTKFIQLTAAFKLIQEECAQ